MDNYNSGQRERGRNSGEEQERQRRQEYSYRVGPARKPRKRSIFPYFIVGIIGILLGGMLFAALIIGGGVVSPPETEPDPEVSPRQEIEEPVVPEEPREHQYTEVVEAVENVTPSVVGITNTVTMRQGGREVQVERGTGSGVIISEDGLVVTNQHVIEEAEDIAVIFRDGSYTEASLVGQDELTDIAVLEVDMEEELTVPTFADSDNLRPGEVAIAIGNPLGLMFQHTVTQGVVSATERQVPIPGSDYSYTFVQTDAAINEGNSGGPLINLAGEIIGINSAKIHDPHIEGIGFAIPSNTVERVIDDIIEYGYVIRPFMGVLILDLSDMTGAATDRGVYIQEITPNSPAHEAGLEEGDVIVSLNDDPINFTAQLFDRLLDYQPGEEVNLEVIRDDERYEATMELEEMEQGLQ